MKLDRYTKVEGVLVGESAFGGGPALWANGKQITNQIDDDTMEVRVGRKHIRSLGLEGHTKTSDWCVVQAKHTKRLAELIELAASQHRSSDGSVVPPPTGADMERRKRFH